MQDPLSEWELAAGGSEISVESMDWLLLAPRIGFRQDLQGIPGLTSRFNFFWGKKWFLQIFALKSLRSSQVPLTSKKGHIRGGNLCRAAGISRAKGAGQSLGNIKKGIKLYIINMYVFKYV